MNLTTTRKVARQLAQRLRQNNGGVVLLHGPMGAGKTTLVRYLVRDLDPKAVASSPTYTIINQYTDHIFHADLYRVPDAANQRDLGLVDLCVAGNYVLIEWPGTTDFPGAIKVTIQIKENGDREFVIA